MSSMDKGSAGCLDSGSGCKEQAGRMIVTTQD
jgi:hypothetical protein